MDNEKKIIHSWHLNADNWIGLIEKNGIESRRLATNKAIIGAVCRELPSLVLDIGCGEGWLAKELYDKGFDVNGVDIVPHLVEKTRSKVPGDFWVASYEEISRNKIQFPHLYDVIVINFALIGKESTENLLAALPRYLSPAGKLIIQTLHPYGRRAINDYVSGWKQGSWDGLSADFVMPYDWYFRTMEDWLYLFHQCGFKDILVSEIVHPQSLNPISVIFTCNL